MNINNGYILPDDEIITESNKDHSPKVAVSAALLALLTYIKNRSETKEMLENKYYISSFKRIPLNYIDKYTDQNDELAEYNLNRSQSTDGFIYLDGTKFVALIAVRKYSSSSDIILDRVIISKDYVSHGIFKQLITISITDLNANVVYAAENAQYVLDVYNKCGFEKQYTVDTKVMKMKMAKNRGDSNKKPIFIVASINRKSTISKAIATITKSPFSHTSIALDYKLKEIYSFGGNTSNIKGGFQAEDLESYKNTDSIICVNCMFIKNNEFELIKDEIKKIQSNPNTYNFWDLINIMHKKEEETNTDSMICSQFVAHLLDIIKSNPIPKPLNLIIPDDLAKLCDTTKFVYNVYEGAAFNYNASLIKRRLDNLSSKAIINEATMKRSELSDEVFGIPELRKYPMPDKKHTISAIKLFNHVDAEHEEELAKNVIKNMKKFDVDPKIIGPNNRLRKYLPKDMLAKINESVTAGTVVGANQAATSPIYIVNYMKRNIFTGEDDEYRMGICKDGMKNLHIQGGIEDKIRQVSGGLDEFNKEAKKAKVYRYKGITKNDFDKIIHDAKTDKDFYKLLTGDNMNDPSGYLEINPDFEEVKEYTEFLNNSTVLSECIEATTKSIDKNLNSFPILTEYVECRPINFYRDIDGEFVMNEITKLRSPSYFSFKDIPKEMVNAVKKGVI